MSYEITTAVEKIAKLDNRIRAVQGGTAAGKTIGILEVLIDLAQRDTQPTLTSVTSESFPHLKRGAIRDFLSIMETQKYFKPSRWNKTDYIYEFENGSKMEFFSSDQPTKVRGPRRDRLFVNEGNNIPFETFEQLEVRTKDFIFLDWNPTAEYWFEEHIKNRGDCDHIVLTYRDNEALDERVKRAIELRKHRRGWWTVYGEGLVGEIEGKIFNDWQIIDQVPFNARLERFGLDFGYTNDPTAIVAIYYYDGGYIVDEIAYQYGLSNRQIADIILNQQEKPPEDFPDLPYNSEKVLVIADSAEPKSVDEIKKYGINITSAEKGKDSVSHGIQLIQAEKISMTSRSVNIIKEYRNYLWETDKDGNVLNTPEHQYSHSMDAIRYAIASLKKRPKIKAEASPLMPSYYEMEGMPH